MPDSFTQKSNTYHSPNRSISEDALEKVRFLLDITQVYLQMQCQIFYYAAKRPSSVLKVRGTIFYLFAGQLFEGLPVLLHTYRSFVCFINDLISMKKLLVC